MQWNIFTMKKHNNNIAWIVSVILIAVIIVMAIALYPYVKYNKTYEDKLIKTNFSDYLSTKDYVKINFDVGPNIMIFKDQKDKCNGIIMPINDVQTNTINQGINKKIDTSPTIHDIIIDVFDNYNISIEMVKITELRNNIYYANLILRQDDRILNIDIKPSDAVALASRVGLDIYFKKDLFNRNAQNICK